MANNEFVLRVRFQKTGRLAYLAHLEVLGAIQRMIIRAQLPYAITQGFSPRMKIAISSALSVGMASYDEYFDLTLKEYRPAQEYLEKLQSNATDGLMPVDAGYVPPAGSSLGASLTILQYQAKIMPSLSEKNGANSSWAVTTQQVDDGVARVLEAGEVSFKRKNKVKVVELEDKLVSVKPAEAEDPKTITLDFTTRALPTGSLRPDVFLDHVLEGLPARYGIARIAQFIEEEDGSWSRPLEK